MNVFKKVKWFLAVLGVFLIILATNLIDKENFLRVEASVENIFNERLLAKELLLDVNILFHQKEMAYALGDREYLKYENEVVNVKITELLQLFDRTKATSEEKHILDNLRENHANLIQLESNILLSDTLYSPLCKAHFEAINTDLLEMSKEQVKQGNLEKFNARAAVDTMNLFSKIEIYMLIFLAIVLQVIILYTPKNAEQNEIS